MSPDYYEIRIQIIPLPMHPIVGDLLVHEMGPSKST